MGREERKSKTESKREREGGWGKRREERQRPFFKTLIFLYRHVPFFRQDIHSMSVHTEAEDPLAGT